MSNATSQESRDSDRLNLEANIEFMVNGDVIDAESIDVSQSGISFETSRPIMVEMRVHLEPTHEQRAAKIVWSKELPNGRHRYGLKFIDQ